MYSNANMGVAMTTGMKEKVCHCPEVNVVKNCEYQNLCSRFKTTLGLPGKFDMSAWQSMCFLSPLTNFLIIKKRLVTASCLANITVTNCVSFCKVCLALLS